MKINFEFIGTIVIASMFLVGVGYILTVVTTGIYHDDGWRGVLFILGGVVLAIVGAVSIGKRNTNF